MNAFTVIINVAKAILEFIKWRKKKDYRVQYAVEIESETVTGPRDINKERVYVSRDLEEALNNYAFECDFVENTQVKEDEMTVFLYKETIYNDGTVMPRELLHFMHFNADIHQYN